MVVSPASSRRTLRRNEGLVADQAAGITRIYRRWTRSVTSRELISLPAVFVAVR
jgi:hypothetical protein